MRIAFAGTPEFAATALSALVDARYQVALVLTQPDRPAGRGLELKPSPVKQLATQYAIPVYQPVSLKSPESRAPLAAAAVDVLVVAAYGLILPPAVLALPPLGCLNIHASLLPRWRGAAPIQRAILAGDRQTGISIMQMDAGLDTGPVLLAQALPIAADETGGSLHDKLKQLGARLILKVLAKLPTGELVAKSQPSVGVTYASKLTKDEAEIDWAQSADVIERQIRAFNPSPVARTHWRGEPLRIWQACAEPGAPACAGTVIEADASGLTVACGQGLLRITELQKAGGKRLAPSAFLAGNRLESGEMLGSRT
jgi:methionyl-tRNA formyltransferase